MGYCMDSEPRPGMLLTVVALFVILTCLITGGNSIALFQKVQGWENVIPAGILVIASTIAIAQYAAVFRRSSRAAGRTAAMLFLLCFLYAAMLPIAAAALSPDAIIVLAIAGSAGWAGWLNLRWGRLLKSRNTQHPIADTSWQLSLREIFAAMTAVAIVAAVAAYRLRTLG
jgi:hypothetical protein